MVPLQQIFFLELGTSPTLPQKRRGPLQSNVITTTQKTGPHKQYHPAASASKHHYALSTNNTPKATDRFQALTSPQAHNLKLWQKENDRTKQQIIVFKVVRRRKAPDPLFIF
jgi:hypothetical protein